MSKPRKTARKPKPAPPAAGSGEDRVSINEQDGVLAVRDPDLFRPGQEAFCRRLATAAATRKDVRAVHIGLASGTCRLEFAAGLVGAAEMAKRFAESVHEAISPGTRDAGPSREHDWTALAVFPAGDVASTWETIRAGHGELLLRNPILRKDMGLARRVARALSGAPGIDACRATLWGRDLEIRLHPEMTSAEDLVSAAEDALRRTLRPALEEATAEEPGTPAVASGLRRAWYMAMAGGSFTLTLVGLVVPGIPTVPFLMATSYYLVRSSPTLNRRLLRSRFFGPILADLEGSGGLRRINKIKLIGLTLVVSVVTLVVIGPPLVLLVVIFAVASGSVYAITRLPGIPSRARRSPTSMATPAVV